MSSKGRAELQIRLSRAENCEEVAGDVRFCVAPQKPHKNWKKLSFWIDFSEFFRTRPNASERIQMHPSASEQAQAGQSKAEIFEKLAKTSRKLAPVVLRGANYSKTPLGVSFRVVDVRP